MKDLTKFAKSSGVYLIGNVITKMLSFFMLPLYTNRINPMEYGVYDLHIAYASFLMSIMFLDIWGGILRFMYDCKEEDEKKNPVTTGMSIFAISAFLYSIIGFVVGRIMNIDCLLWLILYGITTSAWSVFGYTIRGYGENQIFVWGGILTTLSTIIANIILLVYYELGYVSLLISSCTGNVIGILVYAIGGKLPKRIRSAKWSRDLFGEMLRYAAPLSLNSVAYWFLPSYNKVVINLQLGEYSNGLYAIADKFGAIIHLFTQAFQMAWQELAFSKAGSDRDSLGTFFSSALNEYIRFMFLGVTAALPFVKLIFPYIVDKQYLPASSLIPVYMLATLMSVFSSFLASMFSTLKKTNVIFTTTSLGAIVNIAFVHVSIPLMGLNGACIALLFGFSASVLRRIHLIGKEVPLIVNYKQVALLLSMYAIVALVYQYFGVFENIVCLCAIAGVLLMIYRKHIKEIISRLRNMRH